MRYQGILVTDSHAQLQAMLTKNLSKEHALFFAEPVHEASGASVDWYTEAQGTPVALASLPQDAQTAAVARIQAIAAEVNSLAQSLIESPDSPKTIRGNILALALRYPGPEHIYMVGNQPVLTCWGFAPGTMGAQPQDLMRLGVAAVAAKAAPSAAPEATPGMENIPPAAPVAAKRGGLGWLWALLSILLGMAVLVGLFLLAGLLFGPSGCVAPNIHLPGGCAVPTITRDPAGGCAPAPAPAPAIAPELVSALTAEQEKERSLRQQLEDLRRQLENRLRECPRPQPKAEIPPVPEPVVPEQPEPPSLADLMPTTPEPPVEQPKEKPKPQEKPQEKPKPQPQEKPQPKEDPKPRPLAKGEDLRIPPDANKNNDMSFLEGCWDSDSGLYSTKTGEPIKVKYCFDGNGNGSRAITKSETGERCTGSVRAKFDSSGRLHMEADGAPCAKGGSFVPHSVDCTQGGAGKAECYGQERGGLHNKWQAKFRRSN